MSSNILSRLTKLEAENVAQQEEILSLKKQLTSASLSPQHPRHVPMDHSSSTAEIEQLEQTVYELRKQVETAVMELKKYRKISPIEDNDLANLLQ